MKELKKTKIIATLGPTSNNKEVIKQLADEGVNVFRLNFSHGTHEEQGNRISIIKELMEEGYIVGIMGDTKGPEIRTHKFVKNQVNINKDDVIKIYFEEITGNEKEFSVTYNFINEVSIGGHIKIDDGQLDLIIEAIDKNKKYIKVKALNSHSISNHKGVNIPFANLAMPFISQRDIEDIKFMAEQNVDYIAASFTRSARDVIAIKTLLSKFGKPDIKVIAKIENQDGVNNIKEIINIADGIMVARGDLGVEVAAEDVPYIQKMIIEECFTTGKPTIIATQMLESMIRNPVPTRAEVSDVANAIFDNGDCVMLSGETASGNYPIEAVKMQTKIALRIEKLLDYQTLTAKTKQKSIPTINNAVANAVAEMTEILDIKLVVAMTSSGSTPRRIAKYRPRSPIIAVCDNAKVARGLLINWGIYPYIVDYAGLSLEEAVKLVSELAKKFGIESGSNVIIAGGSFKGNTDYLKLVTVD